MQAAGATVHFECCSVRRGRLVAAGAGKGGGRSGHLRPRILLLTTSVTADRTALPILVLHPFRVRQHHGRCEDSRPRQSLSCCNCPHDACNTAYLHTPLPALRPRRHCPHQGWYADFRQLRHSLRCCCSPKNTSPCPLACSRSCAQVEARHRSGVSTPGRWQNLSRYCFPYNTCCYVPSALHCLPCAQADARHGGGVSTPGRGKACPATVTLIHMLQSLICAPLAALPPGGRPTRRWCP